MTQFATIAGVSPGVVARLERDETRVVEPWVLGRIIPQLEGSFREAFPDAPGDAYDYFIPPASLGAWLRNFRLRGAIRQKELASALGVNRESIRRYEADLSRPVKSVWERFKSAYNLNGEADKLW